MRKKAVVRASFFLFISFFSLFGFAATKSEIGTWNLEIKGLTDKYQLNLYFENEQLVVKLQNTSQNKILYGVLDLNSTEQKVTYKNNLAIYSPVFSLLFENGKTIITGFDYNSAFVGKFKFNNNVYDLVGQGKLNLMDTSIYNENKPAYDLTGSWIFSAGMVYSSDPFCGTAAMGGLPELKQEGNTLIWYWELQELRGNIEGKTFTLSGPDINPDSKNVVFINGTIGDENSIWGTLEIKHPNGTLLERYNFSAKRR